VRSFRCGVEEPSSKGQAVHLIAGHQSKGLLRSACCIVAGNYGD